MKDFLITLLIVLLFVVIAISDEMVEKAMANRGKIIQTADELESKEKYAVVEKLPSTRHGNIFLIVAEGKEKAMINLPTNLEKGDTFAVQQDGKIIADKK